MIESIQDYKARIFSYVAGQNVLELQMAMPETLEKLIRSIEPEKLSIRPFPNKWSIREIVAHLVDDELVGAYRIRLILSASGIEIQAFDQDQWAALGKYNLVDLDESLTLFRLLRKANLTLLKNLSTEQWQQYGIHAERGKETIQDIATYYAGHDINHLNQIESILTL